MTTRQDELRAMVAAATPGPWEALGEVWSRKVYADGENRVCFMAHSNGLNDDRDIATSELVAQAPTLATDLADALDLLAKRDAELARKTAALANIRELNMTGADDNSHRWAHSDLIEQEIVFSEREV